MSSNVNDINSEHSPSQSPEISSERFIAKSLSGTSALERNAWVRLKTITTFDSGTNKSPGVTHEELSNEPSHFHSNKHFPRYRELSKQEKTYVEQMNVKLDVNESHHVYVSNSSLSQVPERAPLHVSYRKLADKEIYEANLNQRRRKRSQSNSLSESNVPYENVADPITSCSVRCSPQRNGSVSDIGVDRTNTSMGSGSPVQSLTRFSPTSLLVESLIDQLCKLMERDSGKQKKLYHVICQRLHQMQLIDDTYTIEEFQFMRSHYQKALYQLLAVAKSSTQSSGTRNILLPLPSSNINVDLKVNSEKILEWSRYQHEYQELEYIAKGGFGHVYKVRNKLDGCEYAIKKIYLRYRHVKGFLQSLKEVKMLARLNHPNIVSYKAAWLEPMDDEKQEPQSQRSSGNSASHDASVSVVSINSISKYAVSCDDKFPLPPAPKDTTEDSLDIVFQESSPENKSSSSKSPESHQNSSRLAPKYDSQMQPPADLPDSSLLDGKISSSESSSCHSCSTETGSSRSSTGNAVCPINTRESKKMYPPSSISVRKWATLYVQMQLCQRTLRHWLDERNKSLPAHPLASESSEGMLALNLFRQIVRGVDYIHAQGIVHHDIKPSNIFVNANLKEVQVGDFGLSCCILSRVDSSGVLGDHHGEVGTRLYAAPEQLQGKCTSKSDVYSLGIVFLELLHPFHTDMERSKVIQKLRIGHVPPDLTRAWPLAARLISDLLMVSPAARPSASYLLQCLNSLLQSNLENELSSRLALKDETIRLLQETVASRDREIAELRQRLSLFERQ